MKRRRWLASAASGILCEPSFAAMPLVRQTSAQQANALKFGLAHPKNIRASASTRCTPWNADPALRVTGLDDALPLLRFENGLRDGTQAVSMGPVRTPEREVMMGFIDAPTVYEVRQGIAMGRNDPVEPQNFDALRALGDQGLIVVTRGTADSSHLATPSGLVIDDTGTSNEQHLGRIAAGRARFVYSAISTLQHPRNPCLWLTIPLPGW